MWFRLYWQILSSLTDFRLKLLEIKSNMVVCNCCSGGFKMIPKISHSAPEMSPRARIRGILSHKKELFSLNKKIPLKKKHCAPTTTGRFFKCYRQSMRL